MANTIVWFDLPTLDLQRAIAFYSAVLQTVIIEEYPGVAVFSHADNDVAGCLFVSDTHKPARDGAMLYFNVSGRLEQAVAVAKENGGLVEQPPHAIGPHGYRSVLIDSEGNRIVLHSD